MISLKKFQALPTEEVARLVRASGSKVLVFPINGTRRWFALEYGDQEFEDPIHAFMDIAGKRQIDLYRLCFDHGIHTLLTPVIGPEILATRNTYMQKIGGEGLARFVTHPDFVSFYEEYGVRVHFYGDYARKLKDTPYEYLIELFDDIGESTRKNKDFRIFYGAFADDLTSSEVVAEMAVKYHAEHGVIPDHRKLIEMYYGDTIEKAHIFIGFDRFAAFDYPLLRSGEEDLYFTLFPSLYMDQPQFREILYDHVFTRRTREPDFSAMSESAIKKVQAYYQKNKEKTLGVGKLLHKVWIPKTK
ncbi:MAG: hypothetical protein HYU84_04675 [Chloroflexi bacterium]|nr:hypothetical protein [Chloroflexota bacterium]MBI3168053.1 hypothetical protein [Chloroflexota bacterium]